MSAADREPMAEPGLPGAKALNEALRLAFHERQFTGLLVLDIDDFSTLNRRGERGLGDRVLESVERSLASSKGQAFRVAGDDFVLLFTGTTRLSPERLLSTAERLRDKLAEAAFAAAGVRITLSGGGLVHPGSEFGDDERMADLVASTAEALLIRAKRQGKDRTVIMPGETHAHSSVLPTMVEFYRELARINHSVAEQRETESRIDPLTGLHNRKAFDEVLERTFRSHQRSGRPFAVVCIDTDSLKEINDTQGHAAGDRFLLDVTRVLRETVRASDICSRWGGDEFAIVAENLGEQSAQKLGERIRRIVEDRTDGTVSIGIFCGSPESAAEALKAADLALYDAKKAGKNRVVLKGWG